MTQKVLAPIAIIAVILVVAIGGYLALTGKNSVPMPEPVVQRPTPVPVEPVPQPALQEQITSWKTYNGPYPIRFSYPQDLLLAEGDADYASLIVLRQKPDKNEDTIFEVAIYPKSSSDQIIQSLQKRGFTQEKELIIDGFLGKQFKGVSTPGALRAPQMTTEVVIQVNKETYVITDWRTQELSESFQRLLDSIKFTK